MNSKRIGITLGDPSGIGPEIVAKTIAGLNREARSRVTVFCDRSVLDRAFAHATGQRVPEGIEVIDRGVLSPDQAPLGSPTRAGAVAQVGYLEAAVHAAQAGTIAGIVTAPISKTQARLAGFEFPGHTEFLAARLGADRVAMMFAGPRLRVVLATVHVALAEVPGLLSIDEIAAITVLGAESMRRDFGLERPRVGVVGLNPHCGEAGMFGREEIEVIEPAIEEARRRLGSRADVAGPLIPDAAFRQAASGGHDLLVAMYHDQGLIPVKVLDFERTVNVTLGLPIVRTSPDHGVAYDIAGSGNAQHGSFEAAFQLCLELVERRSESVVESESAID